MATIPCLLKSDSLTAQTFENLDFSNLSSYTVTNRPIGSTGITYSMSQIANVNAGTPNPHGYADGTLVFAGNCANCGPTVRLTFSQAVELRISGKTSDPSWFGDDGLFTVTALNSILNLSDPNNELQDITTSPTQITFNGIAACIGGGATPCSNWTISSSSVSSIDINFTASQLNGTALRFSAKAASIVPTLSQWGLILLGLLILCGGAIVIYQRRDQLFKAAS